MSDPSTNTDTDIQVRARLEDRELIDQAAKLVGTNRAQFMLASALEEARNVLLYRSALQADIETFQKVEDQMNADVSPSEFTGMKRLLQAKTPW